MHTNKWTSKTLYGAEGERIQFTQMRIENTNALHVIASNEEVSKFIGWPLTKTVNETMAYVEEMLSREAAGTFKYANIVDKRFGTLLGTVMLFGYDESAAHAELGYVLDKSIWGKGIGAEVVELAKSIAFNEFGLRKLHARVVSENIGSLKILKRNGFEVEGSLKAYYNIDGAYYDCVWLGCFKDA